MEIRSPGRGIAEASARYVPAEGDAAAAVLSKAVVRAAARLDLTQAALARVLGLSTATASRLAAGNWLLQADSKAWELAALLVRVYRSLDAITGGKVEAMRAWLHSPNAALGGAPAQRLASAEGLVDVLHYLDASRSRI
jgi:transcriptional regulator with XRE-family HTH domain